MAGLSSVHDIFSVLLISALAYVLWVGLHVFNEYTRSATASSGQALDPQMINSGLPWIGSVFDYISHPLTFFLTYTSVILVFSPFFGGITHGIHDF